MTQDAAVYDTKLPSINTYQKIIYSVSGSEKFCEIKTYYTKLCSHNVLEKLAEHSKNSTLS